MRVSMTGLGGRIAKARAAEPIESRSSELNAYFVEARKTVAFCRSH